MLPDQSPVVPSVGAVPVEVPEDVRKRYLIDAEIALHRAQCTDDPCPGHGLAFHEQAQASFAALAKAYPLIATRVRAEERQRVAAEILATRNLAQINNFYAEKFAALAAGSAVPVAAPPEQPVRLCAWCDKRSVGTAWGHLPDGPQPSCGEHGHRVESWPVATPTEPDDGPTHEQIDRSRAENGLPPLYAAEQDGQR